MTTYNKQTLGTFFQTNDVPTGQDFQNLIDSQVNIVETSVQVMGGALQPTELITARVSATDGNYTGTMSIAGITSAADIYGNTIRASAAIINGLNAPSLSAGNIGISGTVSADGKAYFNDDVFLKTVTIAASGVTLGTANIVSALNTRLTSVTNGTATGLGLMANKTGLIQYLYNETATSANLWPCVGGQINALGSGAAFPLAGNTLYIIDHIKASGYAVK